MYCAFSAVFVTFLVNRRLTSNAVAIESNQKWRVRTCHFVDIADIGHSHITFDKHALIF